MKMGIKMKIRIRETFMIHDARGEGNKIREEGEKKRRNFKKEKELVLR